MTDPSTAGAAHPLVAELLARSTFPAPGTAVVCAFSGGPDSTALLVLAAAAGCTVTAIHVDHGLRPSSAGEARAAVALAASVGVACDVVTTEIGEGPNLEARARAARRAALPPGALTGHTADDRAETLLINLLRGAGADGLAAMRPAPTRPILSLRRAETERLCAALALAPLADPSNADRRFVRNRVRAELLPLMDDIAGRDVVPLLARAATLLADDAALIAGCAAGLDPADARALATAPAPVARRAVRGWLRSVAGGADAFPPDMAAVQRVLEVARGEHEACEIAGGHRVERHHQRLRIVAAGALASHDGMGTGIDHPSPSVVEDAD